MGKLKFEQGKFPSLVKTSSYINALGDGLQHGEPTMLITMVKQAMSHSNRVGTKTKTSTVHHIGKDWQPSLFLCNAMVVEQSIVNPSACRGI